MLGFKVLIKSALLCGLNFREWDKHYESIYEGLYDLLALIQKIAGWFTSRPSGRK